MLACACQELEDMRKQLKKAAERTDDLDTVKAQERELVVAQKAKLRSADLANPNPFDPTTGVFNGSLTT